MNRTERYEKDLAALAALLSPASLAELQVDGLDARDIAKHAGCSKPTVYTRLEELTRRGYVVAVKSARKGKRGPEAGVFAVTGEPSKLQPLALAPVVR